MVTLLQLFNLPNSKSNVKGLINIPSKLLGLSLAILIASNIVF
jgi:hypothetical protein